MRFLTHVRRSGGPTSPAGAAASSSPRRVAGARGVKFGRKPTLTLHRQKEARKRLEAGETQRSVARSYNVSQSTISRLTV